MCWFALLVPVSIARTISVASLLLLLNLDPLLFLDLALLLGPLLILLIGPNLLLLV